MQIDRPERGFSYTADAPLDMRMDPSADVTAAGIVNEAAERDLATIFKRYGEERYARQIAKAIVRRRKEQPFERTSDLVETIKAAIPAPARFGDGHPAKRVFQALRIAVNDELGALEAALPSAFAMLRPGRQARRDQLPLARGPDRQALHAGPRTRLRMPARLPGVRLRQDARAALDLPEGDSTERSGDGRESRALRRRDYGSESRRNDGDLGRRQGRGSGCRSAASRSRASSSASAASRAACCRIAIVAALLAGVVATNVAVLRLNMKLDQSRPGTRRPPRPERAALVAAVECRIGSADPEACRETTRAGSRRPPTRRPTSSSPK